MTHTTAHQRALEREERSSTYAVFVFPVMVIAIAALALMSPALFAPIGDYVPYLLMFIMFTMGLTITLPDLKVVATRPTPIVIGVVCQFVVMPLSALALAKLLGLSDAATVGLILLGSVPGGTASNVIAYLAKGDTALSVAMTSVSTLVAPIMTPALMVWLAGATTNIDGSGMVINLLQTVLLPVIAGFILRRFANTAVDRALPILPWLSIITIGVVLGAVVAGVHEQLFEIGLTIFIGVAVQNFIGFVAGHYTAKITGQTPRAQRTTAIEVAMQNSGLASAMALKFFTPEAALPGALAAVWANITGPIFALIVRRRQLKD